MKVGDLVRILETIAPARYAASWDNVGLIVGDEASPLERVLLAMTETAESFEPGLSVFIAPMDEKARAWALPVAHKLRLAGIRTELEHRDASLKSQLKRGDKLRARLALIVGDNEITTGKLTLKDLRNSQQHEVAEADLLTKIHQLLD